MKIKTETPDDKTTLIRCGHAVVRIIKLPRGKYTNWRLNWTVGRKLYRRAFSDETRALSEGERVVRSLATADGAMTSLSGEDISYFNECKSRLGTTPMHIAVDFFLKFHEHTTKNPKTFTEVWEMFYGKRQEKKLSQRYYQTLRCHGKYWNSEIGSRFIDTISHDEYLKSLSDSKYGDRTKHNLLGTLTTVLRFARKQRFVSDDKPEIEADFADVPMTTPEIYTVEELKKLFIVAPKYYLPYIAIMAFAGTRRSEASHRLLHASDVLFEDRMIRLCPEITKDRAGRTLDITPNLEEWLLEFMLSEGPIFPYHKVKSIPSELLNKVGLTTKDNALRHSFCSYHLALKRNAAETAELAGNSPTMLRKHYKATVSSSAAREWFSITPDVVRAYAKEKNLDGLITW